MLTGQIRNDIDKLWEKFWTGGITVRVWFYDLLADGLTLDDKRVELKGEGGNDLPDAIAQWKKYLALIEKNARAATIEKQFGDKTQKAFVVDAADIKANKYDLSINRYKEVVYEEESYEPPKKILKELELDILKGLDDLEAML